MLTGNQCEFIAIYYILFSLQVFFKFFLFLILQYCIGFAIYQNDPPQVYTCSPSRTLLPPPSPYHPSGLSQCTSPKHNSLICLFLFLLALPTETVLKICCWDCHRMQCLCFLLEFSSRSPIFPTTSTLHP